MSDHGPSDHGLNDHAIVATSQTGALSAGSQRAMTGDPPPYAPAPAFQQLLDDTLSMSANAAIGELVRSTAVVRPLRGPGLRTVVARAETVGSMR